jgi:bacillithiol biosynthesis cysteine-adding enzyme BshC
MLQVISTPLSGKGLTQAALSGAALPHWYVPRPRGPDGWRARANAISAALESPDWLSPLMGALDPAGLASERLAAAARGGFVVTSGQQPGLFGGPLYTWWKALSVLAFADALEKATGLAVAPVFWAATDDSDLIEAASTVVVSPEGPLRIELSNLEDSGMPMSRVRIGDLRSQLDQLRAASGSAPQAAILDVVDRAYQPDETVGGAYVTLLRSILAPLGVAVLDASHPAVRERSRPLLTRALERADAVESALLARDSEIKAAGFSPQVQTVRGRSLVFAAGDGRRARVAINEARQGAPDDDRFGLSPNVLLRPILERSILPTLAYLGGPAEIAYFAQVSAVANALEEESPLIAPRWSGMVIEPRVQKILERYSLAAGDFRDPHAVETRLARESLPTTLRSAIAEVRREVEERVATLAATEESGLVSPRVIEGLRRDMLHRIARLERRYAAAVKRKGNSALRDVATARSSLYPFGLPQERALNVIPLIARYGAELFDSAMSEVVTHAVSLI